MEAYEEPQGEAEEEQEAPPNFATPVDKLQVGNIVVQALSPSRVRLVDKKSRCTQEFGITAADIKKLKENGVHSVEALAHSNKRDLVNMKGLSEAKIDKMQKECELPNKRLLRASVYCSAPCLAA